MSDIQDTLPAGANAVYTGFWHDWDRGKVLGATLTLKDRHAVALLAALAVLVTFAGNRSWFLWRYVWHCFLLNHDRKTADVKGHQRKQQVLLRNSETAGGALVGLLWEWKDFGVLPTLRSLKDILLAGFVFAHWVSFIVLGILVSQLVIGKVVISKSLPTCGQWLPSEGNYTDTDFFYTNQELLLNKTLGAESYVRSCYRGGGSQGILDCGKFASRFLEHQVEHQVSCPFDPKICLPNSSSAFIMESSNITLSNLGINSKHGKSIALRRRSTCAVVNATMFKTGVLTSRNVSYLQENETETYFSFAKASSTGEDIEFSFRNYNQGLDYQLSSYYFAQDPQFIAAPLRPKGSNSNEVSMILLHSTGVKFLEKQDDPFFSAHDAVNSETGTLSSGSQLFEMDNLLNVIACDERAQFCSPATGQCTEWHGLLRGIEANKTDYQTLLGKDTIKLNSTDELDLLAVMTLIKLMLQDTAIPNSIQGRGAAAALQASRYLSSGTQIRLIPEQWKSELQYWFMMGLAQLQLGIFNTIDRPVNVDATRAYNSWERDFRPLLRLCGRVKLTDSHHTSLSTLGIAIVLAFSSLLALASLVGISLAWFPCTKKWKFVARWQQNEVLALLAKTRLGSEVEEDAESRDVPTFEQISQMDPFLIVHQDAKNVAEMNVH